jgi:hypothetical protein
VIPSQPSRSWAIMRSARASAASRSPTGRALSYLELLPMAVPRVRQRLRLSGCESARPGRTIFSAHRAAPDSGCQTGTPGTAGGAGHPHQFDNQGGGGSASVPLARGSPGRATRPASWTCAHRDHGEAVADLRPTTVDTTPQPRWTVTLVASRTRRAVQGDAIRTTLEGHEGQADGERGREMIIERVGT